MSFSFSPNINEYTRTMSGKKPRNLKRENEIRRRDTIQRRSEKVILGYIKAVHPKIYKEGSQYFDKLNEAHPQKKDLTKTQEYQAITKNNTAPMNEFELRIELMTTKNQTTTATVAQETCQETPEPQSSTTCQDHPEPSTMCQDLLPEPQPSTTCQDHPEPNTMCQDLLPEPQPSTTCQDHPEPSTMCQDLLPEPQPSTTCQDHPEPSTMCQDLLPLGEEEMEALLDDLRQDSNIASFFANIDYELDNCPLW